MTACFRLLVDHQQLPDTQEVVDEAEGVSQPSTRSIRPDIPQGCVLAPLLFLISGDYFVKNSSSMQMTSL